MNVTVDSFHHCVTQDGLERIVALGRGRAGVAVGPGESHRCIAAGKAPPRPLFAAVARLPALHCRRPSAGRLLPEHVACPEASRHKRHHTGRFGSGGGTQKRAGQPGLQRNAVRRDGAGPAETVARASRPAADALDRRRPRRQRLFQVGQRDGAQAAGPASPPQTGAQSSAAAERRQRLDDVGRGRGSDSNPRAGPPGPPPFQLDEADPPAENAGRTRLAQAQTGHEHLHGGHQNSERLAQFLGPQTGPPDASPGDGLSRNGMESLFNTTVTISITKST